MCGFISQRKKNIQRSPNKCAPDRLFLKNSTRHEWFIWTYVKHHHTLKRGKWLAGTLVNALRVAKIRSNMHTGQNAGSVPSDHGQRQALVEPLLLSGVAWNVNEFLSETAQEGRNGLAVHTSGFDCNWLKVVLVKKVIVFLAFVSHSISCYTAWYNHNGTDYVVTFCKGVHNCRIPYKAPASVPGGQQSFEDGVYGWMSGEAACILNAGEAMKPQPVNKLPTASFRAFENIGTSSQGNCDSELIRAQQVSDAGNWEGFWPGSSVAFLCSE